INPTNANNVFLAGSAGNNSILETTNGGTSWSDIHTGGSSPHADHHGIGFDANGKLLDGNDGGIWRLENPTVGSISWTNLNGTSAGALNITQFIGIDINP